MVDSWQEYVQVTLKWPISRAPNWTNGPTDGYEITTLDPMKLAGLRLRQRDGVSCGPTVAVVAGALLDPARRAVLAEPKSGLVWFAAEQGRVHAEVNRIWPRRLGTTPSGMASALTAQGTRLGITYRWRLFRGRRDGLADVLEALDGGWPVAMLVGRIIPRHWVLIVDAAANRLQCYEPSSGEVRSVGVDDVRHARLTGLGYPRPFAFVVPKDPRSNRSR